MEEKIRRLNALVEQLSQAARAYYQEDGEIMSNREYDSLYDELLRLEEETGVVKANSPTRQVGYEVADSLPKERHERKMLSLDKTKEVETLKSFLGEQTGLLSWKLDGITIVLTYREGSLHKAVTRGNGEVGEVVTGNARVFENLPVKIPFAGELILRGEAVISYGDFARINEEIGEDGAKYKNPRNLCSGSVRQLNNEVTARRNVHFVAFSLVRAQDQEFDNSRMSQLAFLQNLGFETVETRVVTGENLAGEVADFEKRIGENKYPSDGLVLVFDDIVYSRNLGQTSKFPRDSMAFKWADEVAESTLREIEWSASRTGLLNPVAIFDPVELEGTTVSRASLHNISIMRELALGIGDRVEIYKANMIIPQIAENLTKSGVKDIPAHCPVCGGKTEIRDVNGVETLYCANPGCPAKKLNAFCLMVGRDALNIDGLSKATLEKLIDKGLLEDMADLFHLKEHGEEIMEMEGFGEKSFRNLVNSIEAARKTTLPRVIYGLGISNIGLTNARMICREYEEDPARMRRATVEELNAIDKVGDVIASAFVDYFSNEMNNGRFDRLLGELDLLREAAGEGDQALGGQTFVITGSTLQFKNRNEMKAYIEAKGGKVTSAVTSKTTYLVNNDIHSNSSKNKKAKELGIPIITEEELMELGGSSTSA